MAMPVVRHHFWACHCTVCGTHGLAARPCGGRDKHGLDFLKFPCNNSCRISNDSEHPIRAGAWARAARRRSPSPTRRRARAPAVFFSFLPDVNFWIRDLPDVKSHGDFRKTHRFWSFQNFDPKNSATFSEIFWTERGKFPFEKNRKQKVHIWM